MRDSAYAPPGARGCSSYRNPRGEPRGFSPTSLWDWSPWFLADVPSGLEPDPARSLPGTGSSDDVSIASTPLYPATHLSVQSG